MNSFRVAILIASVVAIKGEAQESDDNQAVTSLNSLQNSQPNYPAYPAQNYGSPYGGYQRPSPYGGYPFGYQQPQMYPQPPPMMYPQQSYQPNFPGMMPAPEWGYPSYQQPMNPGNSGKPNYVMNGDYTTGSVPSNTPGVTIDDSESGKPNYIQPAQPAQPGYNFGPPNWQQSFTPISNGCYNRCRPSCSFRPQPMPMPRPMPMPMPRPRPLPMPMPRPMPLPQPMPKPNYGCRSVCRPMCNQTPTCGGGSQFNGNTMVCGMGGNSGFGGSSYQPPNYGMMPYNYNQPQAMPMAQSMAEQAPEAAPAEPESES